MFDITHFLIGFFIVLCYSLLWDILFKNLPAKYRIIKREWENGEKKYIVEKRETSFIWFRWVTYSISLDSYEEAVNCIPVKPTKKSDKIVKFMYYRDTEKEK